MVAERFSSPRARAAALAVAFSVVAGGVVVVAVPQIATAVEEGAVTSIDTDSTSIPFFGEGFTPGNVVYVQVQAPSGFTNYSWQSTEYTVAEDGTVAGEIVSSQGWDAGTYTITLFESDDVQQSFTVEVAETSETPEPTDSVEPTETDEPTETEPVETEPTETEPVEPPVVSEPVETEPVEPPVATEPTETEPAETEPAETEPATVTEPRAWTDQASYTAAIAAAEGVTYHLEGFTPGVELQLVLTLPTGEEAEFASLEPIVPDADGTYTGVITYSGEWPVGAYTAALRTIDGQQIPIDLVPPTTPPADADDAADGAGDAGVEGADDANGADDATGADAGQADAGAEGETRESVLEPAPIQEASFTFTIEAAGSGSGAGNGGNGTGTTSGSSGGDLVSTDGADVFGAAGLGLLVLGAGTAAIVGARFLGRRRNS